MYIAAELQVEFTSNTRATEVYLFIVLKRFIQESSHNPLPMLKVIFYKTYNFSVYCLDYLCP